MNNLASVINKFRLKLFRKGRFGYNVFLLMTGTAVAQLITILISPALTRVYIPENFGVFALFTSIVSVLSVVAAGRYELAIILPKEDEDGINVLVLCVLIAFIVSGLTLFIFSVFNTQITRGLGNQEISRWLYFIPLLTFLTAIFQSFKSWFMRKKQFKRLVISDVSQSGAKGAASLSLGFLNFGSAGLITGRLIGQSLATSILGWQSWKDNKDKRKFISKDKIIYNARKYKSFPKHQLFGALINSFELQMPVFAISLLFNNHLLGLYAFAFRIASIPLSLIAMSISTVSRKKVIDLIHAGRGLDRYMENITFGLTLIAALLIGGIFLLAMFFSQIFGEKWAYASNIIYVLIPMLFLGFISSPITLFSLVDRNDLFLKREIVALFLVLIVFLLSHFFKIGFIYTIATYSVARSVIYIWTFFINFKLSNASFKNYLKLFASGRKIFCQEIWG